MKKLLSLLFLSIAFLTNAMAQSTAGWTQDPVIKETHWFGQYEYEEYPNEDYDSKTITFDGNYLQSIEIVKTHTGQDPKQRPETTFYSWLDHQYRFRVEKTSAWGLIQEINNVWKIQEGAWPNDGQDHYDWDGMGLCNISDHYSKLYILNLKAGDQFSIEYYLDNIDGADPDLNNFTHMAFDSGVTDLNPGETLVSKQNYDVTSDGEVCINVPKHAIIRNIVIRLKEYQVADFDVLQLTQAEINEYDPQHHFGQIGYRYFFKNPGVLEDKRGAAPYITMKFGADNDMTFVRALSAPTEQWNLAETEATYYAKETSNPTVVNPDNDNVITVHSPATAEDATDWDSQFWIAAPNALSPGQTYKVEFKYKADNAATVPTQTHLEPGNYITWVGLSGLDNYNLSFTTEWQTYSGEVTVTDNTNEAGQSGMQSIAFNLNRFRGENTYYFKDIKLYVPERTEVVGTDQLAAASIIDASNNFDPDVAHFQYHDTYGVNNDLSSKFSAEKNKSRLAGKEWSTFSADHDYEVDASLNYAKNGDVVFGDVFNTIWPKYGNFFYFFPEVDGLLHIEFYCEGSEETPAFWYKKRGQPIPENERDPKDPTGLYPTVDQQPPKTLHNLNGSGRTQGLNHYSLEVEVEKGGVYYLCSLPTNMVHERPIVRLKSYAFIPKFMVTPLYKVVKNTEVNTDATQQVAEITGGPYTNLDGIEHGYGNNTYELTGDYTRNAEPEARVKCLGNVVSAKAKVEANGNKQYLSFYDIKFREGTNAAGEKYNPGGAVVAHVENSVGQASFVLTIAYDAADAKWGKDADGKDTRIAADIENKVEVKHWDFYSGKGDYITKREGDVSYNGGETYTTEINSGWNLGKYGTDDGTRFATDSAGWVKKSKLFKETHKADGLTTDWEYDFVDVQNRVEPIFKSVYDMEADNADMIHETAGLVFFTDPNEICLYNENEAPTSSYQDRFIGLIGGGKLIIPRLKADDRVVIKMGAFGNVNGVGESEMEQKATLTLTNAKDAKGELITSDYIIGGSEPFAGETSPANTLPHGEYHFMVANTSSADSTDFAIQVKEADLLKIYSIDIYRNAANNNADILTENSVTTEDGPEMLLDGVNDKSMEFYLRYSGNEEPSAFYGADQVRGNLNFNESSFTTSEVSDTFPYTSVSTTFDKKSFGSFRTEMAVKTQNKSYVTDYAPSTLAVDYLEPMSYPYTWDFTDLNEYVADAIAAEEGRTDLLDDYKGWETAALRNAPEEEPGILFANGGQLYASAQMFAEAAGIGFKRSAETEQPESAKMLNNSLTVAADGLELNSAKGCYKLVLPKVTPKAAVYVRATPIQGATLTAQYSNNGNTGSAFTQIGDSIFVVKNSSDTLQNIELWLNGMKVKKIAVSVDPKSLDDHGWASESRERVIDPDLTWYMTGSNIETVFVTGVTYGGAGQAGTVTLSSLTTPGTEGTKMLRSMATNDFGACLLHSKDNKPVSIIDEGFHLFVPDMHDYSVTTTTNPETEETTETVGGKKELTTTEDSKLRAWVEMGVIPATYTDSNGKSWTNYVLSDQYLTPQDDPDGNGNMSDTDAFYRVHPGGAGSYGHNAYLQLETDSVKPAGTTGAAAFNMVFETNGIREAIVNRPVEGIYTINGVKLDAMPTTKGVYIVNNKKVVIK